jgi:hypothetical protein
MHSGALELALVLLLAAVIAVPVFKKLGLGAVLATWPPAWCWAPMAWASCRMPTASSARPRSAW